ncbi:hypothetical protein GCM10027067_16910 [Pseudactinotalea suaedae]
MQQRGERDEDHGNDVHPLMLGPEHLRASALRRRERRGPLVTKDVELGDSAVLAPLRRLRESLACSTQKDQGDNRALVLLWCGARGTPSSLVPRSSSRIHWS